MAACRDVRCCLLKHACLMRPECTPRRRADVSCARACSGLLPSLIGVCHVAIQFPLYEWSKKKLAERNHCDPNHLDAASLVGPYAAPARPVSAHILLPALSGLCASL